MAHHDLKSFTGHFQSVLDGKRKSEVRINDRDPGYSVGDSITLKEGQNELDGFHYTGREVSAYITHIDTFGLNEGYVNLSLSNVGLMIIHEKC